MYRVKGKIDGMIPAMFDRYFSIDDQDNPGAKKKAKSSWKDELIKKIYVDSKGVFAPVDNIRMMLIGNVHRIGAAKIQGSFIETKKATQYLNFCKSCVWVVGPKDPLKVYFEPNRKTYDDYDERSFITATGCRKITRRPLITTPWRLTFFVDVVDDQYAPEKIKEFFDVAGMRCGLGAYGPTFGRFLVTEWNVVK